MNLSYSNPSQNHRSMMRLLAAGVLAAIFIMALFIISTSRLPVFSSIRPVDVVEPFSTGQFVPHVMPVPTPPQSQPALSTQVSATPSPLITPIHPVAQRVATPPVGN